MSWIAVTKWDGEFPVECRELDDADLEHVANHYPHWEVMPISAYLTLKHEINEKHGARFRNPETGVTKPRRRSIWRRFF